MGALPLPSKGSLQLYCVCVSQTVLWQEPTGWCEQGLGRHKFLGKREFLEPELTHWALQEVSVSPEGRVLHCSVAEGLVERHTVG